MHFDPICYVKWTNVCKQVRNTSEFSHFCTVTNVSNLNIPAISACNSAVYHIVRTVSLSVRRCQHGSDDASIADIVLSDGMDIDRR